MQERVWVGPAEHIPFGWVGCESVEAFLDSELHPERIVIDDRAAALREGDFVRLFEHSPFARIERVVGPWRAGIGRTDPEWPLVTRTSRDSLFDGPWRPLTGGYDELAAVEALADLAGMTFAVQISAPELRAMWIDWLSDAGAELRTDEANVLIRDGFVRPSDASQESAATTHCIVQLLPDPWNAAETLSAHGLNATDEMASRCIEIMASVLDSPAQVMHRILAEWKRAIS